MTFYWERLFPSQANAIAALIILGLCCIICLSYLLTMIYLFKWYIPTQKLLKAKSSSYYNNNTASQVQASHTRTCSMSQNNLKSNDISDANISANTSPNNIRLSITSRSVDITPNGNDTDTVIQYDQNDQRISITAPLEKDDARNSVIEHQTGHDSQNSVTELPPYFKSNDSENNHHLNIPNAININYNNNNNQNTDDDEEEKSPTTKDITPITRHSAPNLHFNSNAKAMAAKPPWKDIDIIANRSNSNISTNNRRSSQKQQQHKTMHSKTVSMDGSSQNISTTMSKYVNIMEEEKRCIIYSLPTRNFRILLYLAISCSTIFIFTTTIITYIILFSEQSLFELNCSLQTGITLFLVIQRILLYSYFILRLSFSFKGSSYRIPKYKLSICGIAMCITSLTPAICAQYYAEFENCSYQPLFICFVVAVAQDIFWALFTLTWYIIKLVALENSLVAARTALATNSHSKNTKKNKKKTTENKKNIKTRSGAFRISTSIAITPTIHEDKQHETENEEEEDNINGDGEEEEDEEEEEKEKGTSVKLRRQRSKSAETYDSNSKKKKKNKDKNNKKKRIRKLSISDRVRSSITSLHRRTNSKLLSALQKNLKIKRLVKKLLILTITAISSTIIVGCSFGWISIWAGISLDLIVNNMCMLLSFRCADNIFKRLYPCCSSDL